MPACAIKYEKNVRSGMLLGKMVQIEAHHLGVHGGELQSKLLAGIGVDGRKEVEVLIPGPHKGYGPSRAAAPSTARAGLQAETAFVEEPDLD